MKVVIKESFSPIKTRVLSLEPGDVFTLDRLGDAAGELLFIGRASKNPQMDDTNVAGDLAIHLKAKDFALCLSLTTHRFITEPMVEPVTLVRKIKETNLVWQEA